MDPKKKKKRHRNGFWAFFERVFGKRPEKSQKMETGEIHMTDYVFDMDGKGTLKSHPAAIVDDFAGPEPFDFDNWKPGTQKKKWKKKGSKDKVDVIVLVTSKVTNNGKNERMPLLYGKNSKEKGPHRQRYIPSVERFYRNALHDEKTQLKDGKAKLRDGTVARVVKTIGKTVGKKEGFRDHTKKKGSAVHASFYSSATKAHNRSLDRKKKKGGK